MQKIRASFMRKAAFFTALMTISSAIAIVKPSHLAHAYSGNNGGNVVIAMSQVPRHLNPAVQSGLATGMPGSQIFATLVRFDNKWKAQPYLAKSWKYSKDKLSLTMNLVRNARFHDGKPITSEDVAFSIDVIKKNHPFKTMFEPVKRVRTPNKYTAIFELNHPHPALLLALSGPLSPIIPKHIYGDGQDLKTHPANSAPVGSGPFKLKTFDVGEKIELVRNEDFFIRGRPYLDQITYRIIRDPIALVLAMENGDADLYPFLSTSLEIRKLTKADHLIVTDKGYDAIGPINWLAFNTARAPLNDVRVRQAIAYAIDRRFITKVVHRNVSIPQRGPIIESSPYFNDKIETYDLDISKANTLLNEAGFARKAGGFRMSLSVDYIPGPPEQQQSVAEYLKSQLKKIGIKVNVRSAPDFPTWAKRISSGNFDMTMDAVFNWGDPVIGVHRTYLSSNIKPGVIWSNTQSYRNPEVDALLNKAAVSPSEMKRKQYYDKFQEIVARDVPIYWLNAIPYHTAYSKTIANPPVSIWGAMQSLDEMYIKRK